MLSEMPHAPIFITNSRYQQDPNRTPIHTNTKAPLYNQLRQDMTWT